MGMGVKVDLVGFVQVGGVFPYTGGVGGGPHLALAARCEEKEKNARKKGKRER